MDSYERNKIVGAVLGTALFVMALSIVAEIIYEPAEAEKPGYVIEVAEAPSAGGAGTAAAAVAPIAERLQTADAAKGEIVALLGPTNTLIGLATPGGGNVISGNAQEGVLIFTASGNRLFGNRIGLDVNGAELGNGGAGIFIAAGATDNQIGGPNPGQRNYVGGNANDGIVVSGAGTAGTDIFGNSIGTSTDAQFAAAGIEPQHLGLLPQLLEQHPRRCQGRMPA